MEAYALVHDMYKFGELENIVFVEKITSVMYDDGEKPNLCISSASSETSKQLFHH